MVTLLGREQAPDRRGMASSVHSSIGSGANALVAGVLAPLVMHSALALALASFGLMAAGLLRPGKGKLPNSFWKMPAPRIPLKRLVEAIVANREED